MVLYYKKVLRLCSRHGEGEAKFSNIFRLLAGDEIVVKLSATFWAYVSAILFACIIGFSFMFVKLSLRAAEPLDALAHRFAIAFLFAMLFLFFRKVRLSIHRDHMLPLFLLAVLNPFLYFLTQALGLVYLPASEAGIIQATLPIFTILFAAWFLKEKTTKKQKLSVVISVLGVMLIFFMNHVHFESGKWLGIALIGISTLTYAGYNVLGRKATGKLHMADMTYFMIFSGFVFFNAIAFGTHITEGTLSEYFSPLADPLYLISECYLGIMASFTTFFLSNFALSVLEASRFGVFTNLTTIVSIFSGTVFLHETLYLYHYIGALMVILGVVGLNVSSHMGRRIPKIASGSSSE